MVLLYMLKESRERTALPIESTSILPKMLWVWTISSSVTTVTGGGEVFPTSFVYVLFWLPVPRPTFSVSSGRSGKFAEPWEADTAACILVTNPWRPSFSKALERNLKSDTMGSMQYPNTGRTCALRAVSCASENSDGQARLRWDFELSERSCCTLYEELCDHLRVEAMSVLLLRHAATHCNTLNTLQHAATHCNTHRNTRHHTASHPYTRQHTATHCNTPPHIATPCNTLQHTATHRHTLQHSATHCSTAFQHTASPAHGGDQIISPAASNCN